MEERKPGKKGGYGGEAEVKIPDSATAIHTTSLTKMLPLRRPQNKEGVETCHRTEIPIHGKYGNPTPLARVEERKESVREDKEKTKHVREGEVLIYPHDEDVYRWR